MTLTEWTDQLCTALGLDLEVEPDAILDLARDAAHEIDRPAAPLTTFIVGYAAGLRGGKPTDLEDCMDIAVEQVELVSQNA
ncbi:MAG: hypothetical protein QOI51_2406 [Nocardioidaceae bacterium]|jgi:hypothetical protein|nr:hypothetical protein [Nocardioidaceae bacterium]MDX6308294.1 hypothetical protein [Nocardioidaceae bacterium]